MQLSLLSKSCRDFDLGDRDEIVRIAQALRVILNSSGRDNVSLASQVGAIQGRFVDMSFPYSESSILTYCGLFSVEMIFEGMQGTIRALPLLDRHGIKRKLVRFSDWWNVLPVLRDITRARYTRRQLVCWMANEDGGSHVDSALTAAYHRLSRGDVTGWGIGTDAGKVPLLGAVDASIRQIAHETLRTFARRHPELLFACPYDMYRQLASQTAST
ncbi:hypothetical protein [Caballeronia mineralivorans]|nr:hypothetical protein [Caballeronia mineralivorans]